MIDFDYHWIWFGDSLENYKRDYMLSITNSTIQFRSNFLSFYIIKNSNVLSQTNEYAQRIGFYRQRLLTLYVYIYIYIPLYMMYGHHVINI